MTANYDYKTQTWYVESPMAMDINHKTRVVKFLLNQYKTRLRGEIGDRKKRMEEAISKLSIYTLEVRLIGNGEKTLYLEPNLKF